MQTSDVSQERLQRLATFEAPEGARVLSLYLNLDPRDGMGAGPGRRTAVTSLLDEAQRRIEGQEGLGHDAHMALRADADRAREYLRGDERDGWALGAHGLAMILCGPADLFEVLRLPRPVASQVHISERPVVEPLAEAGAAERWAVLLVDGNDARLLEGHGDRLEETDSIFDDLRGSSAKGGWSAQRYERSVGKESAEHLANAAEMLQEFDRRRAYSRIFIGTTAHLYSELEGHFDQHVQERIRGRFDAGADWESVSDIREKVEPLLQKDDTHREYDRLQRMRASGVRGLADTLPALYERRVGTLLLEPGLEHPGVVCPRCRWAMAEEQGTCPVDGDLMEPHPNLAEWAVELAIEQDAEVLVLRHHEDLGDSDGIGAALRF